MALETQDLIILAKPFPANAHKFVGENAYLHEEPIAERLDLVDMSWQWQIISIVSRDNAGKGGKDVGTVTAHGRLTIKGVTRDGIGMAVIQRTNPIAEKKWDNAQRKQVETGGFYSNEANEAEKAAATDAFKRAVRMFGVGRYLLTLPRKDGKATVTDILALTNWLKANYGDIKDSPAYHEEKEAEATLDNPPQWAENDLKALIRPLYDNQQHFDNALPAALAQGMISFEMPLNEAASVILVHRAQKDFGFGYNDVSQIIKKAPENLLQNTDAFYKAWQLIKKANDANPM